MIHLVYNSIMITSFKQINYSIYYYNHKLILKITRGEKINSNSWDLLSRFFSSRTWHSWRLSYHKNYSFLEKLKKVIVFPTPLPFHATSYTFVDVSMTFFVSFPFRICMLHYISIGFPPSVWSGPLRYSPTVLFVCFHSLQFLLVTIFLKGDHESDLMLLVRSWSQDSSILRVITFRNIYQCIPYTRH